MNNAKKLSMSVITLFVLCVSLCVISFALGSIVTYEVRDNTFQTGTIDIDLNGGNPIITANEFLFEPGMTVEKPFYIKNNGTWGVYYKLYFSEISGNLGEALDVTILNDNDEILLSGTLTELTKENVPAIESVLEVNQKQNLKVRIHFPEEKANEYQGGTLEFKLATIAVQTKNNTDKEFE